MITENKCRLGICVFGLELIVIFNIWFLGDWMHIILYNLYVKLIKELVIFNWKKLQFVCIVLLNIYSLIKWLNYSLSSVSFHRWYNFIIRAERKFLDNF